MVFRPKAHQHGLETRNHPQEVLWTLWDSLLVFTGGLITQGFLRWCEMDFVSIHSTSGTMFANVSGRLVDVLFGQGGSSCSRKKV